MRLPEIFAMWQRVSTLTAKFTVTAPEWKRYSGQMSRVPPARSTRQGAVAVMEEACIRILYHECFLVDVPISDWHMCRPEVGTSIWYGSHRRSGGERFVNDQLNVSGSGAMVHEAGAQCEFAANRGVRDIDAAALDD